MKILSLMHSENDLIPIEVELTLIPGLPQISILGLPDQHIKESVQRIKSALKMQGFEFPKSKQIIVNLRPSHIKKNSKGLDLAIAAAFLFETEQIQTNYTLKDRIFYGELSLNGDIYEPKSFFPVLNNTINSYEIITGTATSERQISFSKKWVAKNLSSLNQLVFKNNDNLKVTIERPTEGLNRFYSPQQSRLITIIATGEHPTLFAGPSGSGKSTLAKSIYSFIKAPTKEDIFKYQKNNSKLDLNWRPFIAPHHTATPISLIGGGGQASRGEITRAHGGVLLLDEFLEFPPSVQEALREPFEEGCIRVSRNAKVKNYPAKSLILGTTNLCPCGEFTPQRKVACRFSLRKCRSYAEKISGPIIDRFSILSFSHSWDRNFSNEGNVILEKVENAQNFALKNRSQIKLNRDLSLSEILDRISPKTKAFLVPNFNSSHRRELAAFRVARSIADLEGSESIESTHIEESLSLTYRPFEQIKRWD